ncbi:DEAD/DEAH box helicase [Ectothiorhodospiraceae bacterium BW-2]|nr:DEAD/DEAH box helicase [Ectothiorhodospiraceae bacterium BW-2]
MSPPALSLTEQLQLEPALLEVLRIITAANLYGTTQSVVLQKLRELQVVTADGKCYQASSVKEFLQQLKEQKLVIKKDRWYIDNSDLFALILLDMLSQQIGKRYSLTQDSRSLLRYSIGQPDFSQLLEMVWQTLLQWHDWSDKLVRANVLNNHLTRINLVSRLFPSIDPIQLIPVTPQPLQRLLYTWIMETHHFQLKPEDSCRWYLEQCRGSEAQRWVDEGLMRLHYERALLRQGSVEPLLAAAIRELTPDLELELNGCLAFIEGELPLAMELLDQAERHYCHKSGKRKSQLLPGLAGLFHAMLHLFENKTHNRQWLEQRKEQAIKLGEQKQTDVMHLIHLLFDLSTDKQMLVRHTRTGCYLLFTVIVANWQRRHHPDLDEALSFIEADLAEKLRQQQLELDSAHYPWLDHQITATIEVISADDNSFDSQSKTIVQWVKPIEAWQLAFNQLLDFAIPLNTAANRGATPAPQAQRLAWIVVGKLALIYAKEQRLNKNGQWSKGRKIATKRLLEERNQLPYVTELDHEICRTIEEKVEGWGYYRETSYLFDYERALPLLARHPNLYHERGNSHGSSGGEMVPLELEVAQPELYIHRSDTHLELRLEPDITATTQHEALEQETIFQFWRGESQLKVIILKPQLKRFYQIIGQKMVLPLALEAQIRPVIDSVATLVTIHSDIGGGGAARQVEADPRLHLVLRPFEGGVRLDINIRPFGDRGPLFAPGSGQRSVVTEIDGEQLEALRQPDIEQQQAKALIEQQLPLLQQYDHNHWSWEFIEPEQALTLLEQLHTIDSDNIVISWPEGEKYRIRRRVGGGHFSMAIRQQQNWFAVDGELRLDEQSVLSMQQLMELLQQHPNSRFLRLKEGDYLALTEQFRRQLKELESISDAHKQGRLVHPLAAGMLQQLVNEAESLKATQKWHDTVERMQTLEEYTPEIPSTLQAQLRDYQREGFIWLARLAYWGVGGCLADDMGLGKTLQGLTLLLHRAKEGPALVVAPTSVCYNWVDEATKFAPTLNVKLYSQASDRAEMLRSLGPFDLLIVSYGLLQQEGKALAEIVFHTAILDEAQAIKNSATKRSKAAMALQAEFRLITTGTPVENHLGELWNLFRFINPGLLGSKERFNQRFAGPIERDNDPLARQNLRRLLQPFMLRRTKTEVLQELPSRTEITQLVEMEPDEVAFYEALRRNAVEQLEQISATGEGHHQLEILAQITRLRRAVCNPKLVIPNSPLGSPKLRAFGDILEELLENHHKALVFSQFVDHLAIIRHYLDERHIRYQYLDGSTAPKVRKDRIAAFQAGEGELFLISLKAGGVGLNLTAADYVIHMDPWWNPAVEDQASDRAHRIGQKRPVTIYRLVVKGTIEEKIVKLHQSKRDLASNLIEGGDMGSRVSPDELLQLMKE